MSMTSEQLKPILAILKEKNGGKLDFSDGQVYVLATNDATITLSTQDVVHLTVEVNRFKNGKVLVHTIDQSLDSLIS